MPRIVTTTGVASAKVYRTCAHQAVCDEQRRKLLVRQLQEAQKQAPSANVAAGLAHDLKNMMTAIRLHTDLMELSLPAESSEQRHLAHIRKSVTHASELLERLGSFMKPHPHRATLLQLHEEVAGLEELLRGLGSSNVTLKLKAEPCAPVRADRIELQQILLNCVLNAKQALGKGGTVTVRTGEVRLLDEEGKQFKPPLPDGRYAELRITDEGRGLRKETVSEASKPFHRSSRKSGWGVGLTVVHACAVRAGGGVKITNAERGGTVVSIVFPFAGVVPGKAGAREAVQ
jgi:two-component system cell cycle sensor histidine kinase/response regulator CckA